MSSSGGGRITASNLTGIQTDESKLKACLDVGKEMTKTKSEQVDTTNSVKQQPFNNVKKKNAKKLSSIVPRTSYSSSDDELDQTSSIETTNIQRPKSKKEIKQLVVDGVDQSQEKYHGKSKNFYDEDDEDDDDDEDEEVNYEDDDSDSFYDADENPITG